MNIKTRQGLDINELKNAQWDFGITSQPLDERGKMAFEMIKSQCKTFIVLKYDPVEMNVSINGTKVLIDDFADILNDQAKGSILIDSGNLDCGELLLSLSAMRDLNVTALEILYIEPVNYAALSVNDLTVRRQFELTEEVFSFKTLPGYGYLMDQQTNNTVVFSLGYEGERLDRAMEDNQFMNPNSVALILGVPAFRAGWEMNTFANNIPVISKRRVSGGIYFCPANNPLSVYRKLEKIHEGLDTDERLFLLPIGTKPHSIGMCLFTALNDGVGFLYDYPLKRADSSSKVGLFHLYEIEF